MRVGGVLYLLQKKTQKAHYYLIQLCKTPLGETGCLDNLYFTGCLSIQFFDSPLPP